MLSVSKSLRKLGIVSVSALMLLSAGAGLQSNNASAKRRSRTHRVYHHTRKSHKRAHAKKSKRSKKASRRHIAHLNNIAKWYVKNARQIYNKAKKNKNKAFQIGENDDDDGILNISKSRNPSYRHGWMITEAIGTKLEPRPNTSKYYNYKTAENVYNSCMKYMKIHHLHHMNFD